MNHNTNLLIHLLPSSRYINVHVDIAKLIGVESAMLLADLIDQYRFLMEKGSLVEHPDHGSELMYYTDAQAWERCAIHERSFRSIIKKFIDLKFIEVCRFGLPSKNYYRLDLELITEYISNNLSRNAQERFLKRPRALLETPKSVANNNYITIPKTISKKGNDYSIPIEEIPKVLDELLPSIEEEKVLSKFPLKPHQQIYFDQMKELDLESDDHVLRILIRKADKQGKLHKLRDAISHIKAEIEKGTVFKKPKIAMFVAVLNDKISAINEDAKWNKRYALKAVEVKKWNWLRVKDKYVMCENTGKELPLNIPKEEFAQSLAQLYNTGKNYAE
ncbi:hypothetical protein UFOVP1357_32 [uncultured Caudovirales phage]|uniref:Replication protein n=1 Tax=uncultured Caudovirales phage TaxID=2100421 RepID=A0A6J5LH09_9CAUD|nr:hypothetical protein UFOVP18_40 [uncultured Caudovirales phage]CAB4126993.1 hypothetical protein UFOVP82_42 [uncultured Caudovirales phage]CAB4132553.1 hypothetical protein UFOVP258_33 [uncultured Caudovirales phage]CAB4146458.1 hypothetical protein UFOVP502_25 [uncultured Caudovirales phage]CAB4200167.1 hypothetical protein UFOVP1357_32 [uncultured Caudovirales phage]